MNPLKTLLGVALAGSFLIPGLALAEHRHRSDCRHGDGPGLAIQVNVPPAPPAGHARNPGRYELQTTSHWVPGYYTQVWVAEQCRSHPWKHHKVKCRGGYHTQQWVEGRYERQQEWVWVPAPAPYRPYRAAPAVGFQLSAAF